MQDRLLNATGSCRKLKTHKKSRNGCNACKLRRVKCDEGKPQCRNCSSYGAVCNYALSGLQARVERATSFADSPSLWLSKNDELMDKFQARTAWTVSGGKLLELYRTDVVDFARTNSFLKYSILAITSIHDRSLQEPTNYRLSDFESRCICHAAYLLSQQLTRPSVEVQMQASLIATSAILFQITFACIDAMSPEEAWPVAKPAPSDLNWLKLTSGKKEIHRLSRSLMYTKYGPLLTGPSPPTSPSQSLSKTLAPDLIHLWNLDMWTTSNPYQDAAASLADGLRSSNILDLLFCFIRFISYIPLHLRQLLERKDPAALVLLASWFSIVSQLPVWWIQRRAQIEGKAIRTYLLQNHKEMGSEYLIALANQPNCFKGNARSMGLVNR